MSIDTSKFWDFVKDFKGTAPIKDVFAKFASDSSLDSFESNLTWAQVNADLQDMFTKQADTFKLPNGAEYTFDSDSEKHTEPVKKEEVAHTPPVESKPEAAPPTAVAPSPSTPPDSEKQPTPPQPQTPPQVQQQSTVFDRLAE